MFISYTKYEDGVPGTGFSASFTFGNKVIDFNFFVQLCQKNQPVEGRMLVG